MLKQTNNICIYNSTVCLTPQIHSLFTSKLDVFVDQLGERGQSIDYYQSLRNAHRAKENIKIGKYGELIAFYGLRKLGFPFCKIDLAIRNGDKGWDADLQFNKANSEYPNCHVKTCDAFTKKILEESGDLYSWTFQYANRNGIGGTDPILEDTASNDITALIYVENMIQRSGVLIATIPNNMIAGLLRDPISPKLKGIKKCLYYKDLVEAEKNTCFS